MRSDIEETLYIVSQKWKETTSGPLPDVDIKYAMYSGDIFIFPYNSANLTPLGYNFSPSEIIISTKTRLPLKIRNNGIEKFVYVAPHDTVLISTKEYLAVSKNIMGTFHSKVKIVSNGFGHISTTLDPDWKGPLLIALNNPSSRRIKLVISSNGKPVPFVTLMFYYFPHSAEKKHDNPANRIDILNDYAANPKIIRRFIFSWKYRQYQHMLNMLNNIATDTTSLSCNNDILSDAKEIILTLQKMIDDSRVSLAICTQIENLLLKMTVHECGSSILFSLMKCLKLCVEGYCQKNLQYYPNTFSIDILQQFLNVCLVHIQREIRGHLWKRDYEECSDYIVSRNLSSSSFISLIALSSVTKSVIRMIVTIAGIVPLMYLIIKYSTADSIPALPTTIISLLVSIVTISLTYYFFSKE